MEQIYIAGPLISGGSETEHLRNAIDIADELMKLGYCPIVPHYTIFHHFIYKHSYEEWMEVCYAKLKTCSALLRLPGKSKGADLEEKYAIKNSIPIFYDIIELIKK